MFTFPMTLIFFLPCIVQYAIGNFVRPKVLMKVTGFETWFLNPAKC